MVNRPEDIRITKKEAIEYVNDVETAIFHLLKLLYPEDTIIEDIANPKYKIEAIID